MRVDFRVKGKCHLSALLFLVACDSSARRYGEELLFLDDWVTVAEVGVFDGRAEEVFGSIRDVMFWETGAFAVLDRTALTTRVIGFDAKGRYRYTLGRSGPGPNEFIDATALIRIADDSLAVINRGSRTLQVFVRNGAYVFGEAARLTLPFFPEDGCAMNGRIFLLGGMGGRAIHEIDRTGAVVNSFSESDFGGTISEDEPRAVAWAVRDQAQGGYLKCAAEVGMVIHVPYELGWLRAYKTNGSVAWHSSLNGFVKTRIVPAIGGSGAIKTAFDPNFNFSHTILGVAVLRGRSLVISVGLNVPRGQTPTEKGWLVLCELESGRETGRQEFAGVAIAGAGDRLALVYENFFPMLTILHGPLSLRRTDSETGK